MTNNWLDRGYIHLFTCHRFPTHFRSAQKTHFWQSYGGNSIVAAEIEVILPSPFKLRCAHQSINLKRQLISWPLFLPFHLSPSSSLSYFQLARYVFVFVPFSVLAWPYPLGFHFLEGLEGLGVLLERVRAARVRFLGVWGESLHLLAPTNAFYTSLSLSPSWQPLHHLSLPHHLVLTTGPAPSSQLCHIITLPLPSPPLSATSSGSHH